MKITEFPSYFAIFQNSERDHESKNCNKHEMRKQNKDQFSPTQIGFYQ